MTSRRKLRGDSFDCCGLDDQDCLSSAALEERRLDNVNMEPIKKENFAATYRKKQKDTVLEYDLRVRNNLLIALLFDYHDKKKLQPNTELYVSAAIS